MKMAFHIPELRILARVGGLFLGNQWWHGVEFRYTEGTPVPLVTMVH